MFLAQLKLLFERKQLPQVSDKRHFRIELMESLEPANILLRNQQVAGSLAAGFDEHLIIDPLTPFGPG
jgi:hypothetical protein